MRLVATFFKSIALRSIFLLLFALKSTVSYSESQESIIKLEFDNNQEYINNILLISHNENETFPGCVVKTVDGKEYYVTSTITIIEEAEYEPCPTGWFVVGSFDDAVWEFNSKYEFYTTNKPNKYMTKRITLRGNIGNEEYSNEYVLSTKGWERVLGITNDQWLLTEIEKEKRYKLDETGGHFSVNGDCECYLILENVNDDYYLTITEKNIGSVDRVNSDEYKLRINDSIISIEGLYGKANILIADINGKVLYMDCAQQKDINIDVSSLQPGIYILGINGNSHKFLKI